MLSALPDTFGSLKSQGLQKSFQTQHRKTMTEKSCSLLHPASATLAM